MAAPVILYIDTTSKVQVANFLTSQQPASAVVLEAGDSVPMQLHFLQRNPTTAASASSLNQLPYAYIDPTTVTPVAMAIGAIGAQPTAGTFTVTFGANTTAALAYNITAAALATALNALASVTTAGGVTITGSAGGPFRIAFVAVGVVSTMFAVNATILSPTSIGITAEAVTGTASIAEVQVIRLLQNPAAVQNTWTAVAGAMTVTRLQAGGSGLSEIQRITVPQGTYAGGYSLAFGAAGTVSCAYNISGADLQTAFQALSTVGANNATVIQSSSVTWDITFAGTLAGASQSLIVANSTGLSMPAYLTATLNLNVQGIFDFLTTANANSATAILQIQQGASVNTVLQTNVTLQNTLIQGTPSVPVGANPWQTLSQVNALIAAAAYTLPKATPTILGGVIVPTSGNLVVDGSGNISVLTAPQLARLGLGIAADAAIPLLIGALGTINSVDPQIVVSRNINSGSGNCHGFSDSSNFARAGGTAAYCSFDARITTSSANNFDHYAGFQSLPAYGGSGTFLKAYGFVSGASTSTGTITSFYHHYAQEISGAGVVTNQYGLYVEPLSKGGVKNYGLFVDTNVSRFNGQLGIGVDPTAGHTLDVQLNGNAATIFSIKNTDAGASSRTDIRLDNGTDLGILIKGGTGYTAFGLAGDLCLYNSSTTGATRLFANSIAVLNCLPSGNITLSNGSLAFTVSGKGLTGTVAADNASAGVVGELISSSVVAGSAITLVTAVQTNVTTISLTAGDWDVNGSVYLTLGGTTVPAWFLAGVSNVSASAGAILGGANFQIFTTTAPATDPIVICPLTRINVSSTTTIYLVIDASFTTSTCKAYGIIRARRVR